MSVHEELSDYDSYYDSDREFDYNSDWELDCDIGDIEKYIDIDIYKGFDDPILVDAGINSSSSEKNKSSNKWSTLVVEELITEHNVILIQYKYVDGHKDFDTKVKIKNIDPKDSYRPISMNKIYHSHFFNVNRNVSNFMKNVEVQVKVSSIPSKMICGSPDTIYTNINEIGRLPISSIISDPFGIHNINSGDFVYAAVVNIMTNCQVVASVLISYNFSVFGTNNEFRESDTRCEVRIDMGRVLPKDKTIGIIRKIIKSTSYKSNNTIMKKLNQELIKLCKSELNVDNNNVIESPIDTMLRIESTNLDEFKFGEIEVKSTTNNSIFSAGDNGKKLNDPFDESIRNLGSVAEVIFEMYAKLRRLTAKNRTLENEMAELSEKHKIEQDKVKELTETCEAFNERCAEYRESRDNYEELYLKLRDERIKDLNDLLWEKSKSRDGHRRKKKKRKKKYKNI